MTIENPTLSAAADLVNFSHYRHLRGIWIHSIITYFQIHSILTNKPNFRNDKMNITIDMTSDYKIFCRSQGPKNKPNSNPIKPKTNPIKANTNPIQSQSNPICRKGKMNAFAWLETCTMILIMLLAEFTTLKSAKQTQSVFCILYPVLYMLFIKSLSLLSASQRFAVDKLMRKRRSMRIKKLTVSRLVANLMQRRVIWRFCCF